MESLFGYIHPLDPRFEPKAIHKCKICGSPIYAGEAYYDMPEYGIYCDDCFHYEFAKEFLCYAEEPECYE